MCEDGPKRGEYKKVEGVGRLISTDGRESLTGRARSVSVAVHRRVQRARGWSRGQQNQELEGRIGIAAAARSRACRCSLASVRCQTRTRGPDGK